MSEIQASFLHRFSYAPLGEGGHISGVLFWALFGGLIAANPLPPTPVRRTSEIGGYRCDSLAVSRNTRPLRVV